MREEDVEFKQGKAIPLTDEQFKKLVSHMVPTQADVHKCTCNRAPDSVFTVRVKNEIPYCPRCGGIVWPRQADLPSELRDIILDYINDVESGIKYLEDCKKDYGYGKDRLIEKAHAIREKLIKKWRLLNSFYNQQEGSIMLKPKQDWMVIKKLPSKGIIHLPDGQGPANMQEFEIKAIGPGRWDYGSFVSTVHNVGDIVFINGPVIDVKHEDINYSVARERDIVASL